MFQEEYRVKVKQGDCEKFGTTSMFIDEVVLNKPDISYTIGPSTVCTDSAYNHYCRGLWASYHGM